MVTLGSYGIALSKQGHTCTYSNESLSSLSPKFLVCINALIIFHYYVHFIGEKTETQRDEGVYPKFAQPARGRTRVQILTVGVLSLET